MLSFLSCIVFTWIVAELSITMGVCFIQYRRTLLLRLVTPLARGLVATQSISECFLITRYAEFEFYFEAYLV